MFEIREKPQMVERALLIGVYFDKAEEAEALSLLEELAELVRTLEVGIVDSLLVKVRDRQSGTLMGKRKMQEIVEQAGRLRLFLLVKVHADQQRALDHLGLFSDLKHTRGSHYNRNCENASPHTAKSSRAGRRSMC